MGYMSVCLRRGWSTMLGFGVVVVNVVVGRMVVVVSYPAILPAKPHTPPHTHMAQAVLRGRGVVTALPPPSHLLRKLLENWGFVNIGMGSPPRMPCMMTRRKRGEWAQAANPPQPRTTSNRARRLRGHPASRHRRLTLQWLAWARPILAHNHGRRLPANWQQTRRQAPAADTRSPPAAPPERQSSNKAADTRSPPTTAC